MTSRGVERFEIAGPAGAIEAVLDIPAAAPQGVALVCHPHPLQGGTLDNKVAQQRSGGSRWLQQKKT